MKKLVLCLVLFPFCAHAMCLQFYYDKYGQSHSERCSAKYSPQVECSKKGDFYWDGLKCSEIVPAQNCKMQGGEWRGIQIVEMSGAGFYNVCLCPNRKVWDGLNCVTNVAYSQRCQLRVWCESKRQDVDLSITMKALRLEYCPQ